LLSSTPLITLFPYTTLFRSNELPAGVDIIASSTSCGLMLKHDYAHLLEIEDAEKVGTRVYDICEYLWMLHETGELDVDFQPVPIDRKSTRLNSSHVSISYAV